MSRSTERTVNAGAIRTEGATPRVGPPSPEKPIQSAPSPSALHEESASAEESSFDAYRKSVAERERIAESQRADAEDIILSAALLTATVAVFTAASIPGLKPDPRETSAFYLAKASQLFANASGVQINLSVMPPDPEIFSPSMPALWVNSLWFLSLTLSLSCILLASSLQRWAFRYRCATTSWSSPLLREAGLDSAEQGNELRIHWLAAILPVLLRISISFFYVGLVMLLFDSLRAYLGTCQALFLATTSIVGPVILLLQTT